MIRTLSRLAAILVLAALPVTGGAQDFHFGPVDLPSLSTGDEGTVGRVSTLDPSVLSRPSLPVLAPELALQVFQNQGRRQYRGLQGYTDDTLIIAELLDTSQRGAFELQRAFVAPRSLKYRPISYTGDTFVKSNVITRVLQSEVDFVEKGDPSQTALSSANYKFSYKGEQQLDGHLAHVYQVKPRHKRTGLFKGHIYLDAQTGNLLRSEGFVERSPSFFVRKIEFVQDCVSVDNFTFPLHLHTTARARILGKVVLDIYHRDYQPQPLSVALPVNNAAEGQ